MLLLLANGRDVVMETSASGYILAWSVKILTQMTTTAGTILTGTCPLRATLLPTPIMGGRMSLPERMRLRQLSMALQQHLKMELAMQVTRLRSKRRLEEHRCNRRLPCQLQCH